MIAFVLLLALVWFIFTLFKNSIETPSGDNKNAPSHKRCPNCGAIISANARECPWCGDCW